MSRLGRVDPAPHLQPVARVVGAGGPARGLFEALDEALASVLGHKLFTAMAYHEATGESERVYASQPTAYPVGGRKAMNPAVSASGRLLGTLNLLHEAFWYDETDMATGEAFAALAAPAFHLG